MSTFETANRTEHKYYSHSPQPDQAVILASPVDTRLDLAIAAWLDSKTRRTGSHATSAAYSATLRGFRTALRQQGLDLDSPAAIVALLAQAWCNLPAADGTDAGGAGAGDFPHATSANQVEHATGATNQAGQFPRANRLSSATYNQRLAILSSFYGYCTKSGLLPLENPIGRVERRPQQAYAGATALDYHEVKTRLAAIDRATLFGKRDYALLALGLQTGRRLSELATLTRGDLHLAGGLVSGSEGANAGKITVTFRRTKGGKSTSDLLPVATSRALVEWLAAFYGVAQLATLSNAAPVFVSLSRQNRGASLSIQAVADICMLRLGTSKVHSLRHTFAKAMEDSGAKVSDIQARLQHASLATTGRYLAALKRAENPQADKLADLFGI